LKGIWDAVTEWVGRKKEDECRRMSIENQDIIIIILIFDWCILLRYYQ
jgi:hypothetical protein